MTIENESIKQNNISCDYCGTETSAAWDVVIEDCVLFLCHKHHEVIVETKIAGLERRMGEETWEEIKNLKDYE